MVSFGRCFIAGFVLSRLRWFWNAARARFFLRLVEAEGLENFLPEGQWSGLNLVTLLRIASLALTTTTAAVVAVAIPVSIIVVAVAIPVLTSTLTASTSGLASLGWVILFF